MYGKGDFKNCMGIFVTPATVIFAFHVLVLTVNRALSKKNASLF
jgi:hypothetical protein